MKIHRDNGKAPKRDFSTFSVNFMGSATVPVAAERVSRPASWLIAFQGCFFRRVAWRMAAFKVQSSRAVFGGTPNTARETRALPGTAARLDRLKSFYNEPLFLQRGGRAGKGVKGAGGFSLIECVGVLAIIAIVAALLIPSVVRETDQATVNQEMANLNNFSNALVQNILQTHTIPIATGMASAIASNLPVSLNQITTNSRNFTRSFLVDPSFQIGTNTLPNVLPYTQTNNLMIGQPASARVMIVSTLGTANPPNATGAPLSEAGFSNLWKTPLNTKPVNATWSNWNGNGRDVIIQRINLQPLFYQLILNTQDTTGTATFSINTTTTTAVPTNGTGWNSYYLSGSVVGLCSNGVAQTRYVLNRNISFVFENGAWNGQLTPNLSAINSYSTAASNFFGSAWNANASQNGGKGIDQATVLGAMANFMLDYTMAANQTPPFKTDGGSEGIIWLVDNAAANVLTYSGTSGGTANSGLLHQ